MELPRTSLLDQRPGFRPSGSIPDDDRSSQEPGEAMTPNGHVSVNERVPNARFGRYVADRLRDWIRSRDLSAATADLATEYEVAFYDEEALGEVSCLIVVQSGAQLWRAWESADNQREALERSLDNLRVEDAEPIVSAPRAPQH